MCFLQFDFAALRTWTGDGLPRRRGFRRSFQVGVGVTYRAAASALCTGTLLPARARGRVFKLREGGASALDDRARGCHGSAEAWLVAPYAASVLHVA